MTIFRSAEADALPDPEPVADPNPEADAHYGYYGYGEQLRMMMVTVRMIVMEMVEWKFVRLFHCRGVAFSLLRVRLAILPRILLGLNKKDLWLSQKVDC